MIVRWSRHPGASSYKVTVSPSATPHDPAAFAQFGPNTVMGSVGPISPNVVYVVKVEALLDQGSVSSTVETRTGERPNAERGPLSPAASLML